MVAPRILNTPAHPNVATQKAEKSDSFSTNTKSKQSTVFPDLAAISTKATGVYASLNIPSSLKIWSRTCATSQGLQEQTELKFIKEMDQEEAARR